MNGAPGEAVPRPTAKTSGSSAMDRLRVLDLLRFIAAMAVMMHHFAGVTWRPWGMDPRQIFPELAITRFGYLGVNLFFMISGFVIVMSAWRRSVADYAVSRITRLFPAYWFAVILTFGVYLLTKQADGKMDMPQRFLPNLTMLQEGLRAGSLEVVYWTLWVEIHFYVLIGLLVWRGLTYSRSLVFMAGWLLVSVFAVEAKWPFLSTMAIPTYAPFFVAGMAFFLIYTYGSNIILWGLVGTSAALSIHHASHGVEPWQAWPGVQDWAVPAIIASFYLVFILVATHRLDWVRWRACTFVGALTYPLYLLHLTVARPVVQHFHAELGRWPTLALAMTTAFVSAYLVYRLVEKPGGPWLRRRLKAAVEQIRAQSEHVKAQAGEAAENGRAGQATRAGHAGHPGHPAHAAHGLPAVVRHDLSSEPAPAPLGEKTPG